MGQHRCLGNYTLEVCSTNYTIQACSFYTFHFPVYGRTLTASWPSPALFALFCSLISPRRERKQSNNQVLRDILNNGEQGGIQQSVIVQQQRAYQRRESLARQSGGGMFVWKRLTQATRRHRCVAGVPIPPPAGAMLRC